MPEAYKMLDRVQKERGMDGIKENFIAQSGAMISYLLEIFRVVAYCIVCIKKNSLGILGAEWEYGQHKLSNDTSSSVACSQPTD